MPRWEPDAPGRLTMAALDLFEERGYEHTAVADIAARARVTERTFFRYFTDKREVLFDNAHQLDQAVTEAIGKSPDGTSPLEVMIEAFAATSELFDERIDFARRRAAVITSHPSLHERELLKLALLTENATRALRERGVDAPEALLAAEMGVTIFKLAFSHWIEDDQTRSLAEHVQTAAESFRTALQR